MPENLQPFPTSTPPMPMGAGPIPAAPTALPGMGTAGFGGGAPSSAPAVVPFFDLSAFAPSAQEIAGVPPAANAPVPATLLEAIAAHDLYQVRRFVDEGAELETENEEGLTPLLLAASEGESTIVGSLAEAGSALDARDRAGNTAMHLAAAANRVYTIAVLHDAGVSLEARNNANYTPLHVAVEKNHPDAIKALIFLGADSRASITEGDYCPAMRIAVESGNWDASAALRAMGVQYDIGLYAAWGDIAGVEDCLKANPLLLQQTDAAHGYTAVMMAVLGGQYDVIRYLLERGASITAAAPDGTTALDICVRRNLMPEAIFLLEKGFPINFGSTVGRGDTALHTAARVNNLEMAQFLLDNGADLNLPNRPGDRPLAAAVRENHLEIARFLIEKGADINTRNNIFYNAFHLAAQLGRIEHMQLLLDHGADVNLFAGRDKYTALDLATKEFQSKAVRFLLDHGADPNQEDNFKRTPLHYATEAGDVASSKMLIDAGAKIEMPDQHGDTPLLLAVENGRLTLTKDLLDLGADFTKRNVEGQTALHLALLNSYFELAQLMLDRGIDINAVDNQGQTPLFAAIEGEGRALLAYIAKTPRDISKKEPTEPERLRAEAEALPIWFVDWVAAHGADMKHADKGGQTALHMAAQHAGSKTIQLLLDAGLDVNARDTEECTPLHRAAERGQIAYVMALLEHGADPYAKDKLGRLPLHYAAMGIGWRSARQLTLYDGLDINTRDSLGNTPLHYAAKARIELSVKMLLNFKADVAVVNNDGYTPLELAFAGAKGAEPIKHLSVLELFREQGLDFPVVSHLYSAVVEALCGAAKENDMALFSVVVDAYPGFVNTADSDGWAPLHYAARNGNLPMLKRLVDTGANMLLRTRDYRKNTVLHEAARFGKDEIADYLIELGTPAYLLNGNAQTPAQLALESNHPELGKRLAEVAGRQNRLPQISRD